MGKFQKKYFNQLKSKYPTFENDFNVEYSKQRLAIELIKFRKKLGLTQEEYEEITGVPQAKISIFESGNANPRLSTLIKFATRNGYRLQITFKK